MVECPICKHIFEIDEKQNKPIDIERAEAIPITQRDETQHLLLIKYYGGVREYLLTMGNFKDA